MSKKEKLIPVYARVKLFLTPVESSQIKAIGYAPLGKTLIIQFNNDKVYTYKNVDDETFNKLLNAESVGKYFNTHIKGDPKYPYEIQPQ